MTKLIEALNFNKIWCTRKWSILTWNPIFFKVPNRHIFFQITVSKVGTIKIENSTSSQKFWPYWSLLPNHTKIILFQNSKISAVFFSSWLEINKINDKINPPDYINRDEVSGTVDMWQTQYKPEHTGFNRKLLNFCQIDSKLSQSLVQALENGAKTWSTWKPIHFDSESDILKVTRMLKTKCVGDNFKMLVTALAFFVIKILYLLAKASGTNIQKMSPRS